MVAHSCATCAVLFLATLARAAAGEPSCGPEEVCGPQDVEAVEEASVDALRVELLQSRGRLVSPASSPGEENHGAVSDLMERERTKYYIDVWELGRSHVEQQITLARTHSASPNATAPSLPAFPEIGDRVAELAKASNVTVRHGIRIEDGDWPEDGESCPYPTGAPISCIKGWHCCNSRQIAGALPAQLYSVCCQNTGIASKCGTWIFFVGCID